MIGFGPLGGAKETDHQEGGQELHGLTHEGTSLLGLPFVYHSMPFGVETARTIARAVRG